LSAIPEDLRRKLREYGATVTEAGGIQNATRYRLARNGEEATLDVYTTGTVVPGGKASGLRSLIEDWKRSRPGGTGAPRGRSGNEKGQAPRPTPNATPRVGTDEAGKGDYLGPLVVAGVRVAGPEEDRKLRELGVRDSKDLGGVQVVGIAAGIRESLGDRNLRVISLESRAFEARRTAAGSNVNRLLGELNCEIIAELADEVQLVIVDEFGVKARSYIEPCVPKGVRLRVRPRAEDDTAVAAASILARARYLAEMEGLSRRVGFELPRGSSHVIEAARRVYRERGDEGLAEVAKLSFSITQKVAGDAGAKD
jgi:ribonuclease HIII